MDDLKDIFLEQLKSDVAEEGILDRTKIRAKTLGGNIKHKVAKLGGKVGIYDDDGVRRADLVYIDTIGKELDRVYRPRFEKLFKKYFKDASILTGNIIDDHGITKKQIKQLWKHLSSPAVMEIVFQQVKQSLLETVLQQSQEFGIDIKSL